MLFQISKGNAVAFFAIALFFFSCGSKRDNAYPSFADRSSVPVMRTTDVVTMISDSGVTRYRMSAGEWLIYDKAEEPFWDFPKGAVFERFDNDHQTDASVEADSVVYYTNKKLWRLSGNVKAKNLKHEQFETNLLYWNHETEKIYTESHVTITKSDKIMKGEGFESDQQLDNYTLRNVKAIIPIDEEN